MKINIFVVKESDTPGYQSAYHVFLADPEHLFNDKKIKCAIDFSDFIVDEFDGDRMFPGVSAYPAIKKFTMTIED
jgi:hypothetical protein